MRPSGVSEYAMQPTEEGRATLELAEFPEGPKESLLHDVFAVLRIAQHLSRCPPKTRHAGREEFVQFGRVHVDRKNGWLLDLRTGVALLFIQQVASFGRWLKC